jgi:two-component sensor histidine kinase
VIDGIRTNYAGADALEVDIEDAKFSAETAHCLALIASELVVNACKHETGQGRASSA